MLLGMTIPDFLKPTSKIPGTKIMRNRNPKILRETAYYLYGMEFKNPEIDFPSLDSECKKKTSNSQLNIK